MLASIMGILNYANISFKSNTAHLFLLEGLKTYTGRNVSIDGDTQITISIPPKLHVERIHIRNIDGFDSEDFVTVNEVHVEIPLRQLLRGTLRLEEFSADHAQINLIQNKEGKHNWTFDHVTSLTKTPDDSGRSLRQSDSPFRLSLGLFRLTDVSIHYEDQSRGQIIEKHVEHLDINIKDITKPRAEIIGSVQDSPYDISLEAGPLHSLTSGQPWLVHGSGNIAGSQTNIDASLQLIEDAIDGHVNINVESVNLGLTLEKLGFITGQDIAAEKVNVKAKLHGSDFTELYEQAEIKLHLTNGHWKQPSTGKAPEKELTFNNLSSSISWKKPVEFHLNGSFLDSQFDLGFEGDPLHSLASGQSWLVHGSGDISGSKTNIKASFQIIENAVNSRIEIDVENINLGLLLDKLEVITGQNATANNATIKAKLHGSDVTELYEQADIKLQLKNGHWKLASSGAEPEKELKFSNLTSSFSWKKPVEFHLSGKLADEDIIIDLKTNRLMEFFDEVHKLDVDLKSSISGIDTSLKGTLDLPLKTKQFQLDISLKGKDLEKLNPIIDAELPPFNDFSLTGKLISNKKGFILRSADASIGDTHFQASIIINTVAPKRLWTVNLNSRQLQINDFELDLKDLQLPEETPAWTTKQTFDELAALKLVPRLMDVLQAPKMHLNLNLKADKVLSGEDTVGKARLQLHLRDNAVNLNNAMIEIPGGSITATSNFELTNNKIIGDIQLQTNKLDYGITARVFEPGSLLDGVISTRIDLEFSGNELIHLLDHASGQIDFAIWPINTQPAKALNLWATNLYLILLPELKKKKSQVNCLVGLMSINDGKMKEDFFAIDTTKLWIPGNVNVDFQKENIALSLFPQSKTARFFALQSPIRASGSFSDIDLKLNILDVGVTYISFITSPLHVPTRWVFGGKPPEDGSAICEQFFDREYVGNLNEELRKKEQEEIDEILDTDY